MARKHKPDTDTKNAIKNASDEIAAYEYGCIYDHSTAEHFSDVCRSYFKLWEGHRAGEPMELLSWQREVTDPVFGWLIWSEDYERWVRRFNIAVTYVPKKQGKQLKLDTLLPTPNGFTTVGEVQVGDTLFDSEGNQCNVIAVHPIDLKPKSYRVTFTNGQTVDCCEDHLWLTETLKRPSRCHETANKWTGPKVEHVGATRIRDDGTKLGSYYAEKTYTTEEIRRTLKTSQGALCHRVRMHEGIQCKDVELPVDPYFLGLWIGDGEKDCCRIAAHPDDMDFYTPKIELLGYEVRSVGKKETRFSIVLPGTGNGGDYKSRKSVWNQFKSLGLDRNKHIPREYLRASKSQRIALLQGLMDSDGFISESGKEINFYNTNEKIVSGFCELIASLGIKFSANIRTKKSQNGTPVDCWQIQFHVFREQYEVFQLPRKLRRMRRLCDLSMTTGRSRHVHIKSIDPISPVPMRCITVDSPNGTFLFGETMLPTHNSPLGAAVGLYLLCFDDEPGQQVWSAARDGVQAGIVHRHARTMVENSEALIDLGVKVNNSTGVIRHRATNSFYRVLPGDNIKSQEGHNGSCILDEIHVVQERLIHVLDGMGASRPNPLRFEISTAGESLHTYGGKQWKYGHQVNEGFIRDISFFFKAWAAPQDITDEEIKTNREVWRAANPAMGETITEREFEASLMRASRSAADMIAFKQRRLNIWARGASQFIKGHDWLACKRDGVTFADFQGYGGGLGLDMARNNDTAAACFVFPWMDEGDILRIWPVFWVTESGLENIAGNVSQVLDWRNQGDLIVVEGHTITNEDIVSVLSPMIAKCRTRVMAYDPTFTVDIVQQLTKKHRAMVAAEFQQTFNVYANPTAEFEASVIDHKIGHPNNEFFNWQVGHCEVKVVAGKKKPLKNEETPWAKIDGVQAAIMGVHAEAEAPRVRKRIKTVAVG